MKNKTIAKIRKRIWLVDCINAVLIVWVLLLSISHHTQTRELVKVRQAHIEALKERNEALKGQLQSLNQLNLCRDQVDFLDEAIRERRWR